MSCRVGCHAPREQQEAIESPDAAQLGVDGRGLDAIFHQSHHPSTYQVAIHILPAKLAIALAQELPKLRHVECVIRDGAIREPAFSSQVCVEVFLPLRDALRESWNVSSFEGDVVSLRSGEVSARR